MPKRDIFMANTRFCAGLILFETFKIIEWRNCKLIEWISIY
ncbi:hypothetical protein LEP1GSC103_3605 [Leptospira borgpetersenii serovar Javanica str. UI 09931]|uniref:Uncharacterized protein n=3 Tax=Leptospira borgpetersenii TaxID=174 RepID=A0A0S2IPG8_LEPBO|nr:hypothetical protein LBBP_01050 [Leptospira borgpetersenii serovar Ballum]EKQ92800.1 hypothetical protein LEP1GSC101_3741 [Leptospira borgpetersenii str. UI 09149]EKQ98218.1 hypothetical protein LEP1GSC121_3230 [Leptospira borgpetersenii serovar Castellonis str. 200801910]EMN15050.1 hypothetical protein LEP1GSC055_1712 [Leptospira borgpetersenii str. Brem 307]EMN17264.1 hypothetical protein LEP1GSC056_1316 [Leptospira borgpetersenii str. Brem 328]EMN59975.1 hypothetical protein LEP1GSC090_3